MCMSGIGQTLLKHAFGQPSGTLGRVGGRLMANGNGATERHLTRLAECAPGETVLVIGPGPGVGVREALEASSRVIAVDPSPVMLKATLRRCRDLLGAGHDLTLRTGTAERLGQEPSSVDAVISVNNIMIWPDRRAGLAEMLRVLRPGGRLLVSAHEKWLPTGLVEDCEAVGFEAVKSWTWEPPGRSASTAAQLKVVRPAD